MPDSKAICRQVEIDGFSIIENILTPSQVGQLSTALSQLNGSHSSRKREAVYALRNLLDISVEVRELAESHCIRGLVTAVLGPKAFPVRGIFFDKIPGANWKVPWHQDVTIAVKHRVEIEGFGPWSTKAEVLHVQPPANVLENVLSVRIHLDDCGEENGALRVVPGSHKRGRIDQRAIPSIRREIPEHVCVLKAGGALLMRPLLLHASSPSIAPKHRRVIHIDFSSTLLPSGLEWLTESYRTADESDKNTD